VIAQPPRRRNASAGPRSRRRPAPSCRPRPRARPRCSPRCANRWAARGAWPTSSPAAAPSPCRWPKAPRCTPSRARRRCSPRSMPDGAGAPGLKRITTEARDLFRRPLLADELARFDAVVIDPPRAGAEAQVAQIARRGAGDRLRLLQPGHLRPRRAAAGGGRLYLDWVQVVDQFRWSPHVELAARLVRRPYGAETGLSEAWHDPEGTNRRPFSGTPHGAARDHRGDPVQRGDPLGWRPRAI
jgi:hypothetical protein